jgi:predicted Ser/Thr protein kinase
MNPEQFKEVRNLFEAALEREPSERATFVAQACPDGDVQTEVLRLLEAHDATVTLRPSSSPPSPVGSSSREGQRLGDYEILRLLGRGGMGSVYLARRADDAFQKHVAIKILRSDAASSGVVRRFQREREILAQLEHPHIARLLDAGETEDGLPYFVMEYVEGRSISDYADDRRLPIRERIELFRQVCEAVEYAHQRRIVHRDLKPGNVLVTSEGQVKLLDFGIARLLQQETGTRVLTHTDLWLMTPEYASPEQVRGEPVDRTSDVYSLGVILFELLTGHRPYHMRSRIFHEVIRVVCEEPPTRPSLVIAQPVDKTDADGRPSIQPPETAGRLRHSSLEEMKRELSGDIDNIVLKALEKDASRRYQTPHEFSEDLERHLAGASVSAKGASMWYLGAKFARRYRWWVAGVLAIAVLIATGAVKIDPLAYTLVIVPWTLLAGYHRARNEFGKRRAERWVFWTFVLMTGTTALMLALFKVVPNSRNVLGIINGGNVLAAVGLLAFLIRWLLRQSWAGPVFVKVNRPMLRINKIALILMISCWCGMLGLFVDGWISGDSRDLLYHTTYLVVFALIITLYWSAWGKTEAHERGLLAAGGYWPWSRIKSYKWESTEAGIAILELKGRSQLEAWWWPRRIAVPLPQKQQIEAILERQLGNWPDLNPTPVESGWRDSGFASQSQTSRLDWLILGVGLMPIVFVLFRIVVFHSALPVRQAVSSADSRRGDWILISSAEPAAQTAQEAVVQFHDLFSHARYDKICSIYEPRGRPSDCEEDLKWRRVRLGVFEYTNQTSFDGRFDGKVTQVELRYATRYENGEGVETFRWNIREGRAKLATYSVLSDALFK